MSKGLVAGLEQEEHRTRKVEMAMNMQEDVIRWLLQEDNPPVRYLTLTNLLKKPDSDAEVQQTKACLMEYVVTHGILAYADEFWNADDQSQWRSYWKYTGRYWQLIFLSQFLADGRDPRIRGGAQEILLDRRWVKKGGMQCLTANLLAAFMRLGYGDHPTVVEETEALARRILADDGIACEAMLYSLRDGEAGPVFGARTRESFLEGLQGESRVFLERIWEPVVEVSGGVAMVWAPYDFHLDGVFSHCGVDVLTFLKLEGGWKVASVTYDVVREGCEPSPLGAPGVQ